ncbi:DNA mismatch repair protein MutS [Lutibaculum baratangense AMV1]|uniref:DNA mismatch repair protein MutS n=2 Tax=Lutibaculum TaxID=1358438 RepID=V4TIZ0_9HYPH|nr:DNA mismatch repair protein MutS [Lutibaculum baratangense]ESR25888.1 DNA mismatch repair protein MutS [Lutibaculum baratangense AMV1]
MTLEEPRADDADVLDDPRVTPMMRQYLEIKAANPDCLLFYRMGDFYELFFEDAEAASRALGITLTVRGKHLGRDIPMCGVPLHTADDYLQRLIAGGFRVAVCEQLEDPSEARKRGSKSVVQRDVVRLVTPGTLTEERLLDSSRNNFLAALGRVKGAGGDELALAWADISTGEFRLMAVTAGELPAALARVAPGELLVSDALYDSPEYRQALREAKTSVTPLPSAMFDSTAAERRLLSFFAVASLDGFGDLSRADVAAAGALVAYVDRTQKGGRPPLRPPRPEPSGAVVSIDPATRANLELTQTLSGERKGSLLWALDRTVTSAGARELAKRLSAPLTDLKEITRRLDAVGHLVEAREMRASLREALKAAPDLARSRARLALMRGGPRDLACVRDGVVAAGELATILAVGGLPAALEEISARLGALSDELRGALATALVERPPLNRRDGNFIADGYRPELDEARALRDESRQVVAGLQATYQDRTGVRSLKVKHNNVLGYFVEVTAQHEAKMRAEPLSGEFFHRQSLANQIRFSTNELADLEGRIASAADRAMALENEIFDTLCHAIAEEGERLDAAGEALGELDVLCSLAEIAAERDFVRPEVQDGIAFDIEGGRHPVVEQALEAERSGPFVANDCVLGPADGQDAGRLLVITGPNMGGKSTFLRQNALIALLAQAGSFVPARRARIGIVDRLFSRVGAADDLARGRSTFMVEMVETAAILNQAGPRSLVILDEIGRGTATFDGLSIAWAAIEHLHEVNRCRSLFATHFHELTALAETLPRVFNATLRVKEWQGDVVFLHEVVSGTADRSYGVQVARLAGLPEAVLSRAKEVLERLEDTERKSGAAGLVSDLPLFAVHLAREAKPAPAAKDDALRLRMRDLAPDDMTPRDALAALYELKRLAEET